MLLNKIWLFLQWALFVLSVAIKFVVPLKISY